MPGVLRWLGAVVAVTGLILVALAIADQQTSLSIETVVAVSHVSPAATDDNGQQKLAIGPDDSLVIAYTAADNGLEQAQLAKSDDNGRSWNHLATLGRPGIWSDLPSLVTGADGAIHAAWVDYETVGHVWYTPLGPDGRISPEKISPGPDYAGFPVLAATPEALHVLWYGARPNADTDHGSLYEISHSVKSDSIWSDPEVISTGSEDALNPTIASGPENTVYGAWFQARSGSYGIEFATYNRQWTPSRLISNDALTATGVDIDIAADDSVSLVWEEVTEEGAGIAYARRIDGTWTEPRRLALGLAQDPSVASDRAGRIVAMWSENNRIRIADISDATADHDDDLDFGPGTNPVAQSGEAVRALWTAEDQGGYSVMFGTVEATSGGVSGRALLGLVALVAGVVLFGASSRLRQADRP